MESVRLYFAQNIEKPLALDQVCDANGCSRVALQQAFRGRMLGYGSLAWFSRRFHALTGQTPGAYRRAPHPLHLCER